MVKSFFDINIEYLYMIIIAHFKRAKLLCIFRYIQGVPRGTDTFRSFII